MVMTRDNMITNRLVRQGKLPKSMLEVYPQRKAPKIDNGTSSSWAGSMASFPKSMPKVSLLSRKKSTLWAMSDAERTISNFKKLSAGMGALNNKEFRIIKRKAKTMK